MPHRSGPPTHVHDRLHEYFYLLDGEIHFQLGQEVTTARTGAMLSIPAGTVHGPPQSSTTPITRSAELNTQRWLRPGEGTDLLTDKRDEFQP
jgi:mannose-6-phosphate isomerase-like protein (cupin superfamily)